MHRLFYRTDAECCQRRGPIGDGQVRHRIQVKVIPIEGFRVRPGEIGIVQKTSQGVFIDMSGMGQMTTQIHIPVLVLTDPVIKKGIAGSRIEGDQAAIGADPGNVGDPANIEYG